MTVEKCSKCGSNVLIVGTGIKHYEPVRVYIEMPRDTIYQIFSSNGELVEQPVIEKDKKLILIANGSVTKIQKLEIATPEEVADILGTIPKQEEATKVQEEPPKKQDIDDLLNTESTEIPETQDLNETLNIEKNIIDSNKK